MDPRRARRPESRAFWTWATPLVHARFAHTRGCDADAFYGAVNTVAPGLIRVDADEVSYPLHVILRFELEQALFDGSLEARTALEWSGMEWNGMGWDGMGWNGVEWNGMEWNGMEWNGVESSRVESRSGMEWNGMESSRVESSRVEWNGMS